MSTRGLAVGDLVARADLEAHPGRRAVDEGLVLPDRHFVFEVIDELAAGVKGGGTMPRRDRTHDSEISDAQRAHAVHRSHRLHVIDRRNALSDLPQPVGRAGVGGVLQIGNATPAVVVAHDADKEAHAPGGGIAHGREGFVERQRRIAHLGQSHGSHGAPP